MKGSSSPGMRAPVNGLTIAGAQPGDLLDVEVLLTGARLSADAIEESLSGFVLAREDGRLVAAGCLEPHGTAVLLRSIATAAERRNQGLAARVVNLLLDRARAGGHSAVYLLTDTAEGYFERFGFRRIDRADAPPAVRESGQFTSQTCESAVAMVLEFDRARAEAAREA